MTFFTRIVSAALACLLGLAVSLCAITAADAKVIVRETTKYYNVSGKSGRTLYLDMIKKGPRIKGNKKHLIATASFDFNTRNIKPAIVGNQCRITDVDLIVSVTYRMPRWNGAAKASPAMRRAWQDFIGFVDRHEKQHGRIAREFAEELLRTIKGVRGDLRKDCSDMAAKMEKNGPAIAQRHNARQAAFDASSWGLGGQNFRFDHRLIASK